MMVDFCDTAVMAKSLRAAAAEPRSICVFLPNWVGDVAMATPALRALRRRYPAPTRLIGVGKPHLFTVLEGTPWLDDRLAYDRRGATAAHHSKAVIERLRALEVDMAVLLASSFATAWVAFRSGAGRRIGFGRNLRGWLLTDCVAEPGSFWKKQPWPTVDQYLELAIAAGCEDSSKTLEISTTAQDEQAAERVWRNLEIGGRHVVCVNNHSLRRGGGRKTGSSRFVAVSSRIRSATWFCSAVPRNRRRRRTGPGGSATPESPAWRAKTWRSAR
jgi:heptosyltransferase-2